MHRHQRQSRREHATWIGAAIVLMFVPMFGACRQQQAVEAKPWQHLLPVGAELAASGVPPIAYVATPGEEFFIVDETAGYLVASGRLPADERSLISIDPEKKAVLG